MAPNTSAVAPPAPEPAAADDFRRVAKEPAQVVFENAPANTQALDDFIWSLQPEPHRSRRHEIMKAHPEIQKLFGFEWRTKYIVSAVVLLQIGIAIAIRDWSMYDWRYWLVAYVIGATANHALFLAIHEITHNLAFKEPLHNRLLAIVANLPIGIPYSAAFKEYHTEHHRFQGVDGVDTDLPTALEAVIFRYTPSKIFFCTFQVFFYALRPMLVRAKPFTSKMALNWAIVFGVDALIYLNFGINPLIYFLVSDFLACSLHPCAGHFIAEHFVFVPGYETFSYYGPLNYLTFNVGYHNEHHDFPNIAWSRLPDLKRMAPEFYDNLPQHQSWVRVIYEFITDPNISAYNRVKRKEMKADDALAAAAKED